MALGSSHSSSTLPLPALDVLIAGAGIMGLSLALELHSRGTRVLVFERDTALRHASFAAAGMLAANDPHNPPALLPLSQLSTSLYPGYLHRIEQLSGIAVPFQTDTTLQYQSSGNRLRLDEHSIDPRQLATALLAAVRAAGIEIRELCEFHPSTEPSEQTIVYTTGAWLPAELNQALPLRPRKGQMLRVQLPPSLKNLCEVHRSDAVYIVPRTLGPQAGTAIIGSTVEDAGFDTATHPRDLLHLRTLASELLPALASESVAPQIEAWAGLRPHLPDGLPALGPLQPGSHHFIATGHFRNGILLAPATAVLLADLITGKTTALDLTPFSPARFSQS